MTDRPRIAVLDDYEGALGGAPAIQGLAERAELTVHDRPLAGDDLERAVAGHQIVVALRERTPFDAATLDRMPDVELIAQTGGHIYHVDAEAAADRGVVVAVGKAPDSPLGSAPSVMPELVFGMAFALLRDIPALDGAVRAGQWPSSLGRAAHGQTLGILGLGRHGTAVANAGAVFGMRVIAWGPTLDDERARRTGVERRELDELLGEADIVSIHLKLSDESRGLLDRRRLGLMGSRSILINTARGAIVDQEALVDALEAGEIGGAGLDVFDPEPLPADSRLRRAPRTVLTPHVGWTVDTQLGQFAEVVAEQVTRYLDGRLSMRQVANPAALEARRRRVGGVDGDGS